MGGSDIYPRYSKYLDIGGFITYAEAQDLGWKGRDIIDFANWMNDLDEHLVRFCGMTHEDLPDFDFAGSFSGDVEPEEVAL